MICLPKSSNFLAVLSGRFAPHVRKKNPQEGSQILAAVGAILPSQSSDERTSSEEEEGGGRGRKGEKREKEKRKQLNKIIYTSCCILSSPSLPLHPIFTSLSLKLPSKSLLLLSLLSSPSLSPPIFPSSLLSSDITMIIFHRRMYKLHVNKQYLQSSLPSDGKLGRGLGTKLKKSTRCPKDAHTLKPTDTSVTKDG